MLKCVASTLGLFVEFISCYDNVNIFHASESKSYKKPRWFRIFIIIIIRHEEHGQRKIYQRIINGIHRASSEGELAVSYSALFCSCAL